MPNYCTYSLRAKGTPKAIDELEARLTDYDHTPHFWRVFEAIRSDDDPDGKAGEDDVVVAQFDGSCAWSVYSCMCEGEHTYASDHGTPETATSLHKTAKELGLEIEVFSEEPGIGFAEHFHYGADGGVIADETCDFEEVWWDRDEYPTFDEFAEENDTCGLTEEDFGEEEYASVGGFGWDFAF